ncbi:MAG: hypothetical protein HQL77_07400 [Magnetococcales bacterium]|nr:hypothetical protein [Magnetococcales bacterium]
MTNHSNPKLEELPPLPWEEAAWVSGIATQAMEQFLLENQIPKDQPVPVTLLLQTAFHLLGYKQNQIELLTRQLQFALERERELSQALLSRLGAPPIQTHTAAITTPPSPVPKGKKKAGKKKKNDPFFT